MGGNISKESKRLLVRAKIKPGCILHLYCDFTTPPKHKFLVVVGSDENQLLVLLVNSQINALIQKNPILLSCQVQLEVQKYEFLSQNSFLDCTKVFDVLYIDEVIEQLLDKPDWFKGEVKEQELQLIIQAIHYAPTISELDKEIIFRELGG